MNRSFALLATLTLAFFAASCQTALKPPPPSPVQIESLKVFSGEFQGRIEAYADVSGSLTSAEAQMVEPRQWREGYRLYIEIHEQLPIQVAEGAARVPFQRRIPIEIGGLAPGVYIINVNGREEHLEIDGIGLRPAVDRGQFL
ncbi:MAG: hypothetical protein KDN20_10810 [Verrucomicrobiae bacterium]|nr:hypothetical protein [Verrucomicrobiae bacterium]